jgi:hypothetical protein
MNRFLEIGRKHGTDKVYLHNYHEIYPQYIEKHYNSEGGMVEVGLLGGASLKLWLELFPNMHIYGLDINPPMGIERHERYTLIKTDQSIQSDLDNAFSKIEHPIWFINDDGSHIPEHQLLTFNTLFPKLEVGGVYIIEDIETSYWTQHGLYGYTTRYGLGHPKSIIEIFKKSIDGVNHRYLLNPDFSVVKHQKQFHSITFAQNCIIIVKGEEKNYPYPHERNL